MARTQYFVVLHEGQWKIKLNGEHHGPYASQAAAIQTARNSAQQTAARGGLAQVLVQGENNLFRTEWTYGNDPNPPRG